MKKLLFASLLALTAFFSMPVASHARATCSVEDVAYEKPVKGQIAYVDMGGGTFAVFVYTGTRWKFIGIFE